MRSERSTGSQLWWIPTPRPGSPTEVPEMRVRSDFAPRYPNLMGHLGTRVPKPREGSRREPSVDKATFGPRSGPRCDSCSGPRSGPRCDSCSGPRSGPCCDSCSGPRSGPRWLPQRLGVRVCPSVCQGVRPYCITYRHHCQVSGVCGGCDTAVKPAQTCFSH